MRYYYFIFVLLPLIVIGIGWFKGAFKHKHYTPFIWYLVYSLINQIIMLIFASNGMRNVFLGNIFNVMSVFFCAAFLFRLHYDGKIPKKGYLFSTLPTLFFYFIQIENFNHDMILLDVYTRIVLSIGSCWWLLKLTLNTSKNPIKIPSFWFCTSLVFFNLGGVLVFNMTSVFDAGAGQWLIDLYNLIADTYIILYYILIIIGTLCISKNTTSKYSY